MGPLQVLAAIAGAVVFFVGLVTQKPSMIIGGTAVVFGTLAWAASGTKI